MSGLRLKCQVLRQVEHYQGMATKHTLEDALPELTKQQVTAQIQILLQEGRIYPEGKRKGRASESCPEGRMLACYKATPDWEKGQGPAPKQGKGKRVDVIKRQAKRKPRRRDALIVTAMPGVLNRDKKIALLKRLASRCVGTDRDVMIGILADYGHKYTGG